MRRAVQFGKRRGGFTLLELLVAAGVTAVVAAIIVGVVGNVAGFWRRSSDRLSAEAQARFIFDQLTLDLQGALYRDDGRVWLAADVLHDASNSGLWETTPNGLQKPPPPQPAGAPGLQNATFGRAGVWLRFFTNKRGRNTGAATLSAPVAVGWQIIRRQPIGSGNGAPSYCLHRAEVSPAHTLDTGFDITSAPYATAASNLSRGDPATVRSPLVESVVGENVIDFGVRLSAPGPAGHLVEIFPRDDSTSHRGSSPPGIGSAAEQFPAVVDVHVRILTEEGAQLIAGLESVPPRGTRPAGFATDADYWWPIALAHSHVFTRRIALVAEAR